MLLMLLVSIGCYAQQDSILSNCSFNMDNGRMTLTNVEIVNNTSANVLYNRALNWISSTYKNPEYVIKSKDKDAGYIIFEGYSIDGTITSKMDLRFKDNKFKWIITDFTFKAGKLAEYGIKDAPLEAVPRYDLKVDQVIIQLKKDCKDYIDSFRKYMFKDTDNW